MADQAIDPLFNPLVLVGMSALCVGLIYLMYGERLYAIINTFLLLVTVIGSKLIPIFGHETNTGNIFYASVFLATYILVERFGTYAGYRSIWIGVTFVAFFEVLLQLTLSLSGLPGAAESNQVFQNVLGQTFRLSIASLGAFVIAQTINVFLFSQLRIRWQGRLLWLRANLANAVAQIFDGAIFFTIAFYGVVQPSDLLDIAVTGYLLKVIFMMAASFVLYGNMVSIDDSDAKPLTVTFLR